jgi:hypothetical protein
LDNAAFNVATMKVPWEKVEPGPAGEYLEVLDVDPASDCCYAPLDLNDNYLLAQDGLDPSEGNPAFHQQMVYAVAMTTIRNFERALGRSAFWAPHMPTPASQGSNGKSPGNKKHEWEEEYVQRLRIFPHALREANAFYSPERNGLLFGYFPASTSDPRYHLPGGIVFTCLSHDIVAHETTHALLHGMHRRFNEPSNPDVLAFHEGFADIVALFQHFSMADALRHQIARTRGDLATENLLLQLAQEFGQATGSHGALRDALGEYDDQGNWKPKPADPTAMDSVFEPHARGSLLVAAVFDAFVTIFKTRTADLVRIATGGTGVLPAGNLHPDLVNRMATEAATAAQHVLTMCIRALDYCPPVDLTFGEFLRALITADYDLVPNDEHSYRIAFVEAFRKRGIYPRDVRNLSIESLLWIEPVGTDFKPYHLPVIHAIRKAMPDWDVNGRSKKIFDDLARSRAILHQMLEEMDTGKEAAELHSLLRLDPKLPFEIHSLRPARRVGPDGQRLDDLVIEITQSRPGYLDEDIQKKMDAQWKDKGRLSATPPADFRFRGGCTLLVDLETERVRYCLYKNLYSENRLARQRAFQTSQGDSLRATYFSSRILLEPFAFLHRAAASAKEQGEWML